MAFKELEKMTYELKVGKYVEARRPPEHIRDKVDLSFRIEDQSVVIFEIRPFWRNPEKIIESMVAKASFVRTENIWKIYWQRADMKWHSYGPEPEVDTIDEFLEVVEEDSHGCFFG